MFDYSSINPLNPKIKNLILICFPCSFHTEEVERSFKNLYDHVPNSHLF